MNNKIRMGFVFTGSFCTFSEVIKHLKELSKNYDITVIMSFNAYNTDTRFGLSKDFKKQIEEITGNKILNKIVEVEPIGQKKLFDILVVSPCTGNTMSKIANAITDTPSSLAVKSHLRNQRPVVIAISTNDGLSFNAKNLGELLNAKNVYFVPFGQDDYKEKPNSLVAHFELLNETVEYALKNMQIQPIIRTFN